MTSLVLALLVASVGPFDDAVDRIEMQRRDLAGRYQRASPHARATIRADARAFVVQAIEEDLFPAWLGTPWGLGRDSDAARPHQPDKTVSCSYFVTAILENAGLRLESRARFAQAPALWIERALLPGAGGAHRFGAVTPEQLRRQVAMLGDGLYVIGLDYHVGFVVVSGSTVRMIHASYFPPRTVVDEPVERSAAIAASRRKGYWVSPIFRDDRLVDHWLRRASVPAPPRWPPGP